MTLTKDSRRNGPFGCPILRKCDEFKGDLSCGSDGRIYMNDCHLNYTKCRGKKFLKPMPLGKQTTNLETLIDLQPEENRLLL